MSGNITKSIWYSGQKAPQFKRLDGNIKTDVLIVGAGMAGVLCAKTLQDRGVDYILCEAQQIGSGTSGRTTAVISAQHDVLYSDLIRKRGEKTAKLYLQANLEALEKYRELAKNTDCDFENRPSVMFSQTDGKKMKKEVAALKKIGFNAGFITHSQLPLPIAGGVVFPNQGQFHPIKFLYAIAEKLNIYENTPILKIHKNLAYTDRGIITAKKIIVTAHFPFINPYGMYFAKLYQKRSFVVAIEGVPELDATYTDSQESGLYFRSYKKYMIIGGGDRRTGNGCNFTPVRRFIAENYPKASERFAWAAQDCISLDSVPYIGRYSRFLPNVFVASGFNEWGMTTSMVASQILCDMVMSRKNPYEQVFLPSRSMLHPQLFANLGVTALSLLTPTKPRCTHMGCALHYNKAEHSWDCRCHGSRFSENGEVEDNPALKPFG